MQGSPSCVNDHSGSVSYTHLDVYKRQALATIISQFVSVFLCMGRLMNPVSGECQVKWREVRFDPEMTRMIPVSYTHLEG